MGAARMRSTAKPRGESRARAQTLTHTATTTATTTLTHPPFDRHPPLIHLLIAQVGLSARVTRRPVRWCGRQPGSVSASE